LNCERNLCKRKCILNLLSTVTCFVPELSKSDFPNPRVSNISFLIIRSVLNSSYMLFTKLIVLVWASYLKQWNLSVKKQGFSGNCLRMDINFYFSAKKRRLGVHAHTGKS